MKVLKWSGALSLACAAALAFATAALAQPEGKVVTQEDVIKGLEQDPPPGFTKRDLAKLKEAVERGPEAAERRFPRERKSPTADMVLGRDRRMQLEKLKPEERGKAVEQAAHDPAVEKAARELPTKKPDNAPANARPPWERDGGS